MPSNFRTYEAQSRLLAAVIASNPSLKFNFKAIALHYGSDSTESSIEHRFRSIKKQAAVVRKAVAEGTDAKAARDIFFMNDKDIAKYFGESTPMGIEFQFRSIRKDAKALRDAVDKGESPLSTRKTTGSPTVRLPAAEGSARKRKAPAASARGSAASSTQATPKKRARTVEVVLSNEEESLASDVDYDQLDTTPVSTPAAGGGRPAAPDATPALSVGATPPDDSPDAARYEFHTAPRIQPGARAAAGQSAWVQDLNMSHFDDDDDDDDDDVFIIDTPSKVPKMEAGVPSIPPAPSASTVTAAPSTIKSAPSPQQPASSFAMSSASALSEANEYSLGSSTSWYNLSQGPSQSQNDFSFATSSAWAEPDDFFEGTDAAASFSNAAASFYDDDAAI